VDWQKFKDADDKRCSNAGKPVPVSSKVCDEAAKSVAMWKCKRPQKLYVAWCGKCQKQRNSTGKRYVFIGVLLALNWSFSKLDGWMCDECTNPKKPEQ
jgi:hypothetical protein